MEQDKKYTPKEAAQAVLKKAEELLKSSAVAKQLGKTEVHIHVAPKAHETGSKLAASEPAAQGTPDKAAISPASKDAGMPDGVKEQVGEGEGVERNGNPGPGAQPTNYGEDYKGHLKLAQWQGRMAHKRSLKSKKEPQNG